MNLACNTIEQMQLARVSPFNDPPRGLDVGEAHDGFKAIEHDSPDRSEVTLSRTAWYASIGSRQFDHAAVVDQVALQALARGVSGPVGAILVNVGKEILRQLPAPGPQPKRGFHLHRPADPRDDYEADRLQIARTFTTSVAQSSEDAPQREAAQHALQAGGKAITLFLEG
jgi:hypothetical protein